EDGAEVAHGHVMLVHGAGRAMARFLGRQVRHDLVAVEIEIHPRLRAASFGAPEQAAVEGARGLEVVDGEGEVEKGLYGHADDLPGQSSIFSRRFHTRDVGPCRQNEDLPPARFRPCRGGSSLCPWFPAVRLRLPMITSCASTTTIPRWSGKSRPTSGTVSRRVPRRS